MPRALRAFDPASRLRSPVRKNLRGLQVASSNSFVRSFHVGLVVLAKENQNRRASSAGLSALAPPGSTHPIFPQTPAPIPNSPNPQNWPLPHPNAPPPTIWDANFDGPLRSPRESKTLQRLFRASCLLLDSINQSFPPALLISEAFNPLSACGLPCPGPGPMQCCSISAL